MSLPGLIAQPLIQAAGALNPFDAVLTAFNSNPYFIGIMMLVLNLGGRFLIMEVSKEQERFFQNPWVRRFLIFTVLFVATRNIAIAAVLTAFVVLTMGYLFNENSSLCIFGKGVGKKGSSCASSEAAPPPAMTIEEQEILRRLTEKQMRTAAASKNTEPADPVEDADDSDIYKANLTLLRST